MGKVSNTHKIVIIMLLTFCGQVFAAPFLNCCVESKHDQHNSMEMNHQAFGMNSHNHDMNMMTSVSESGHDHDSMPDSLAANECNLMCDMCLASSSTVSRIIVDFANLEGASPKCQNYTFFNTSSNLDQPFRPPISA